ncbi:MAG TPA: ester cyclase [Kofleriaceae bacterium]|nr:ester cyclase [Kofleriaceae bacterium]
MYDLKKHLAEFAASKWNEWKASLADDVIYEEIATHTRVKGADEYLKIVQRWKRAFPDLKATVLNTFTAGDKIFAEVEWEGTQTGPLDGPFGTIAPTNKRGLTKAALFATVKNDKLVEFHQYFDMMTLLANLGIAPFAAAPAQVAKPGVAPAPRRP